MCVKCDLGHPEACDNAEPEWMQTAVEKVGAILDEIASSAAGMEDCVPLDERNVEEDAERIVQTVLAVVDAAALGDFQHSRDQGER